MSQDHGQSSALEAIEALIGEIDSGALDNASFDQWMGRMIYLREQVGHWVTQTWQCQLGGYWRVRPLQAGEDDRYLREDDLWEPPASRARRNRCNPEGMPVLYCSLDGRVSLQEAQVGLADRFLLIKYQQTQPVSLGRAGFTPSLEAASGGQEISTKQALAHEALYSFLDPYFRGAVSAGQDSIYLRTSAICHAWLKGEDGWIYPSMRGPVDGENVAFLPVRAREKLEVWNAWLFDADHDGCPANAPGYEVDGRVYKPRRVTDTVGKSGHVWRELISMEEDPSLLNPLVL